MKHISVDKYVLIGRPKDLEYLRLPVNLEVKCLSLFSKYCCHV